MIVLLPIPEVVVILGLCFCDFELVLILPLLRHLRREKLDGSLMTLYFYGERWRVASSKLPEGNGKLPTTIAGTEGWTMAQLFWEIFYQKGYNLPNDTECCYMFEMTSPANLVVVRWITTLL